MMSVQLEFVGHACFRLWENGRPVLVTDPLRYEQLGLPDPGTRFEADTVIASSLTDEAHSNVALVKGSPHVINALDVALGKTKATISGQPVITTKAREDPKHPEHEPMDNALYAFKFGDLWFVHMGDVGPYQLPLDQLAPFTGHCDVLFALTGEQLTPKHEELDSMIDFLKPKWLVPMHYNIPPVSFEMSKIDDFIEHRADDPVFFVRHHTVELPLRRPKQGRPTIVVLDPSAYQRTG